MLKARRLILKFHTKLFYKKRFEGMRGDGLPRLFTGCFRNGGSSFPGKAREICRTGCSNTNARQDAAKRQNAFSGILPAFCISSSMSVTGRAQQCAFFLKLNKDIDFLDRCVILTDWLTDWLTDFGEGVHAVFHFLQKFLCFMAYTVGACKKCVKRKFGFAIERKQPRNCT